MLKSDVDCKMQLGVLHLMLLDFAVLSLMNHIDLRTEYDLQTSPQRNP